MEHITDGLNRPTADFRQVNGGWDAQPGFPPMRASFTTATAMPAVTTPQGPRPGTKSYPGLF